MSRLPLVERLLKAGTMTDSLGVYVPAMALQRIIGLVRVVVFMHLLASVGEYGLWALGVMIFDLGGQVVTLGSNHGVTRYVSFYEARGQLQVFYRRMRWLIPCVCLVLTALAFLESDAITRVAFVHQKVGPGVGFGRQRLICWAAIGNALVLALYLNMLSFTYGLRAYRLASMVEVCAGVLFMILGTAGLLLVPTGLTILLAHGLAVALTLVAGMVVLHRGLSRIPPGESAKTGPAQPAGQVVLDPSVEGDQVGATAVLSAPDERAAVPRGTADAGLQVFKFGIVVLAGSLVWRGLNYVSFIMTHRAYGEDVSGVFGGLMRFAQPVQFIGGAMFMVVFSHVARRWEIRGRSNAIFVLETAYKVLVMALMSLSIMIYAAAPLWLRILPVDYRLAGAGLIGGQLMFFQAITQLSIMNIIAKLREHPSAIALVAIAGGMTNIALAHWWIPQAGAAGAAWAAGVGMFLGGGAVAVVYMLFSRVKLHFSTYLVLAAPAALLLPPWAAGLLWAGMLAVAGFTNLLLSRDQKHLVNAYLHGAWKRFRRAPP